MLRMPGGFGSVYWGVYQRQDVAVKVITSHTPKQHERFLREIATLRACTHPCIVQVDHPFVSCAVPSERELYLFANTLMWVNVQFVGACIQEEKTFMAMEFMAEGDLYSKLVAGNRFRWFGR